MSDNAFSHLIPQKKAGDNAFAHLIPQGEEQPQKRTTGQEIGRQLGLTGRAIAGGLAQSVEPFTEPVRYLLDKAGVPGQKNSIEQNLDAVMSQAGVPEPESGLEKNVQGVSRFVASLAGGVGETALANKLAGAKPRVPELSPPTTGQLADRANAAYKAAEDSGVIYRPESIQRLVQKIDARMQAEKMHPKVHSETANALKAMSDFGKEPLGLADVENLRKIAKDVASSSKGSERRFSKIMTGMIDDFIDTARSGDAVAGDAKEAAKQIKQARDLWTRKSKSETIERLFDVADINKGNYSQAGFEHAIRVKFKELARNEKKMRLFTPEEQAAIKQVAVGGKMDNALKRLGKLAPRGIISGILAPGAVMATLGPEAAAAMALTGEAARRGATSATMRNAQNVAEMVRRGGTVPASQGLNPIPPWILPAVIGLDEEAY